MHGHESKPHCWHPRSHSIDIGRGWLTSPLQALRLSACADTAIPPPPPKARFTCAINLAWVDFQVFQWSATPRRSSAHGLLSLRDTLFKTPCPVPMVHVGVPRDPGYQPHMHKGVLKQVSPEEITAAYIMTISRDIDNQEEDHIMSEWVK